MTKLLGLQYKIYYKKGSTNNVVDALSRKIHHQDNSEVFALSTANPVWLVDLQDSYTDSDMAHKLLTQLLLKPEQEKYKLTQGIIRYKGRIWLGHSTRMQQQVMQALHSSPMGVTLEF
jgi:hypothetical protein